MCESNERSRMHGERGQPGFERGCSSECPLPAALISVLVLHVPPFCCSSPLLLLWASPHFLVDEAALKLGAAYLASLAATYLSEAAARRSGTGGYVHLGL